MDELWQEFTRAPESGTRIIDLLDDDIDLTPALHRAGPPDPALEFLALQEKFASMAVVPPRLSEDDAEPAYTTIGELAKAGVVEVRHAPAKTTPGEETLLTVDDLAAGRPPSGRAGADRAHVVAAEGDVIASVTGIARVHNGPEVRLGPALSLYRADPGRLDPEFLAGCLRAAELPATSGSTRIDARRVRIPRCSLEVQRRYGRAFRQLADFEDVLREAAGTGRDLVRLGLAGLVGGRLAPGA